MIVLEMNNQVHLTKYIWTKYIWAKYSEQSISIWESKSHTYGSLCDKIKSLFFFLLFVYLFLREGESWLINLS